MFAVRVDGKSGQPISLGGVNEALTCIDSFVMNARN